MTSSSFSTGTGNGKSPVLKEGTQFKGYFPLANAGGPGLIVLQEIYGVNDEVRRVVDSYAEQGFRALAPDLLWRVEPDLTFEYADREAARVAIGSIAVSDIVQDILEAARTLRQWGSGHEKLGILAFGWGGQHALSAAQGKAFEALATYYPGNLAQHVPTAQGVGAPLQFHFAARDTRTPPELRTAFRRGLAERDDVEIYTYADPDHGFANQGRPELHSEAAALADSRSLEFLTRTLKA
jgi:carboxymethylenebutenolidase